MEEHQLQSARPDDDAPSSVTRAYVGEIERLNRLYSALGHVNQALVRVRTREELLRRICDVLVAEAGFRMAWIGWHDAEQRLLVPVTSAGDERGYLTRIRVRTDEHVEARGPVGQAFRNDRPYICNDVASDPATDPWRTELDASGWLAIAAFPIRRGGCPSGVLSVYADRRGAFREKEISLLSEAAADISFALDMIEREAARTKAEQTVKRLAAIVESTDDAIIGTSLDGTVTSWNAAAEAMFGYSAAEIVGRPINILIPADRLAENQRIVDQIKRGERIEHLDSVRLRKDGRELAVTIKASPIRDHDTDTLVGISRTVRDIREQKQAEALADREQRFANGLIEAMPGIFYLYDETGRFLRWNRNFERVSGYAKSEIATMHPLDFFGPDAKDVVHAAVGEVFAQGESTVEASLQSKDGTQTPYFFTGKRIELDGAPRLVGVGVDIGARRRAEEAVRRNEERYRTTLDSMMEGCQLIGHDWRYLYMNPAAAVQNRRPNEELLGRTMQEAWPGIEASFVFGLMRRCMDERIAIHDEGEFEFLDGSAARFDIRVHPVPEGIFVLSIDITERWNSERALRELNENLERKVVERTMDLDAARERAESADRMKSAFLAAMSHELRTPLNSILGFTSIVLKGMAGPLTPEQSKQLGMVKGSARHLLDLINDVLDISKIEAGQLEVRRGAFDLRASVERVTASVLPLAEKKGLTLTVSIPARLDPFVSDQRRIEQILLNLLNNAIKFTDRGEVTLTLVSLGDSVRVQVADTGIGIQEGDLTKLFQPFRQLDAGIQRQHEGTGLGLAICRRLTDLLGGTIHAESVHGRGSVFTVVLPSRSATS